MTAIPPSGKIGDRLVTSFVTPWSSIMVRARSDELQRCQGGRPVSGLRLWSVVCLWPRHPANHSSLQGAPVSKSALAPAWQLSGSASSGPLPTAISDDRRPAGRSLGGEARRSGLLVGCRHVP